MTNQHSDEIKALQREMIKVSILEAPGSVLLGLGLYARFGADGEPFLPILADESVVMGMLVAGGAIVLWGSLRFVMIGKRRKALENLNRH